MFTLCQSLPRTYARWAIFLSSVLLTPAAIFAAPIATLEEALASKQDLWGLAAMQQPNGASYEFFAPLLPPLRYVNAKFRHYPIVLSAPGSAQKARLISNGSAVNAAASLNTWQELGVPVTFSVGSEQTPFGGDLTALDGPRYEQSYLPIVQMDYRHRDTVYREEAFASVDPALSDHGVVFVQFSLKSGQRGDIFARLETTVPLERKGSSICDEQGREWLAFNDSWQWDAATKTLSASLSARSKATLIVATTPLASPVLGKISYAAQKKQCAAKWESLLAGAMSVDVPEPVVNASWKASLAGLFALLHRDRMNYSAGNLYQTMYEAESGDAVRAVMLWGLTAESRAMIPPLLDYGANPGLRFHDAAFKLQLLAHYYWMTRDAAFVREQKARWQSCIEILTRERDADTGLLPRESYCGDEHDKVFSLNSNANAWRGLRDMALVLEQLGETSLSQNVKRTSDTLRAAVLKAGEKSERRDVQPSFMPMALLGEEKPYDVITATRRGSYWNLMIPYVLGSGIFTPGSTQETSILRYLEEHGGLFLGLIRFHQHSGLFANEDGVDDLYGLRYVDVLLRQDEVERALVSFYGKLAHGMTRDTFLSAEGTGLRPLDKFGRPMYLPPTCSGTALHLWTLRSMLVQDQDIDGDGEPETLRLLFATPRRWLEHGQQINVQHAPTVFGKVSVRMESKLHRGEVVAAVELPERQAAKKILLRARVPEGWRVQSAKVGKETLAVDADGTVDISKQTGSKTIRFKVQKSP